MAMAATLSSLVKLPILLSQKPSINQLVLHSKLLTQQKRCLSVFDSHKGNQNQTLLVSVETVAQLLKSSCLPLTALALPFFLDSKDAVAAGGEFGIFKGRTFALIHPVVMGGLFVYTLWAGYLGWQWRRVRTVQDEINQLKKQVKPIPVTPDGVPADPPQPTPIDTKIQQLTEGRKELIKGGYKDKHFNAGSILLGFGVSEAIFGGLNTWLRTGKLFPGPHLFAGAGEFLADCEKNDDNKEKEEEEEEEEEYKWAMQLATSSVVPMVMQAVVDLGVLEIISKTGRRISADEIASQLELTHKTTTATSSSSMLDRMLCLLAAHSILTCTYATADDPETNTTRRRRLYGISPIAKYFIPDSHGISLGPFMSLFHHKVFMDSWPELKPAVLEGGIPFNRVHGMHAFDYPGTDPMFNEVFNKAMISNTTTVMTKILDSSYKGFHQLHQLVDVGGGLGVTLHLITSKYPHIKGINFDLPHVIQLAPHYPGVEHVAGNMFESVPRGDAIFMKWILHDWSDDHCLKLLKNCYKALPEKGKVIIVEGVIPLVPDNSLATKGICQLDLIMMTQNPGGKERTNQEFLSLATAAGFAGVRSECFVCNFWVMEFYK